MVPCGLNSETPYEVSLLDLRTCRYLAVSNVEIVQLYSKLKLSTTRLLLTDYNIVLV